MLTLNSKKHLLVTSIALALAACGGGGGSNGPGATKGVAVDGYLEGSTVVCDLNGNGIADEGEQTTTTGAGGVYKFNRFCNASTVLTGGTNVVSDTVSYTFTGLLKAPKGSTVITPITTLIAEIAGENASIAEIKAAQKVVATLLDLPENTDLTHIDPIAKAEEGDESLLKTTLAVQQLVSEIAKLFTTSTPDADLNQLVISKLVETIQSSSTPLIDADGEIDNTLLTTVIENVNDEVPAEQQLSDATAAATAVKGSAETLSKATDLADLNTKAEEKQNPTNPPVVSTPTTTNYLFVEGNNVQINGDDVSFATGSDFVGTGANVNGKLQTIGFDFDASTAEVSVDSTVSIGLEVKSSDNKTVQVIIDKVDVIFAAGNLTATVAEDALVKVFVKTTSEANVELRNLSSDIVDVTTGNVVTLNYAGILNRIKNNAQSAALTNQIDELINITGTVDVKLVANKLNLRFVDGTSLPVLTANVNTANSTAKTASVTGYGVQGKLVITE